MTTNNAERPVIPEDWIRDYVDQLLDFAGGCPEGGLKQAVMLRADHVMDLVKAWREKHSDPERKR